MNRREFLTRITTVLGIAASGKYAPLWAEAQKGPLAEVVKNGMIYRELGKTREKVSVIGLGGYHIGRLKDEQESIRIIRNAIDRGITFMDNCWDYNKGESEIRMGKALKDGYREKVFLMTKLDSHSKAGAAKQIDESLSWGLDAGSFFVGCGLGGGLP